MLFNGSEKYPCLMYLTEGKVTPIIIFFNLLCDYQNIYNYVLCDIPKSALMQQCFYSLPPWSHWLPRCLKPL